MDLHAADPPPRTAPGHKKYDDLSDYSPQERVGR